MFHQKFSNQLIQLSDIDEDSSFGADGIYE